MASETFRVIEMIDNKSFFFFFHPEESSDSDWFIQLNIEKDIRHEN